MKKDKNKKKSFEINFDDLFLFALISKRFELESSAWWLKKAKKMLPYSSA